MILFKSIVIPVHKVAEMAPVLRKMNMLAQIGDSNNGECPPEVLRECMTMLEGYGAYLISEPCTNPVQDQPQHQCPVNNAIESQCNETSDFIPFTDQNSCDDCWSSLGDDDWDRAV